MFVCTVLLVFPVYSRMANLYVSCIDNKDYVLFCSVLFCSVLYIVQFSLVQDGIYGLGTAHMRSTTAVPREFPQCCTLKLFQCWSDTSLKAKKWRTCNHILHSTLTLQLTVIMFIFYFYYFLSLNGVMQLSDSLSVCKLEMCTRFCLVQTKSDLLATLNCGLFYNVWELLFSLMDVSFDFAVGDVFSCFFCRFDAEWTL